MTTAVEHHQAHLRAWNDVLFAGDEEEVTEAPADLQESVDDELADVTDVEGAARLALRLEETAAATYLDAIPQLVDSAAISLAATIQPIDMQHAAVLRFVLGEYPVPETFASTDQAYTA
jgi:rubrerythrin